jgi:RNA polymerase sigma factor (sigma-70 family)
MSGDTTEDLRDLIERLRNGDDSARRLMLDRVYHRLQRIAAAMFQKRFPTLHAQHDVNSVVDEAWAQLMMAMENSPPDSVEHFFSLIFRKVRHVLHDMARRENRPLRQQMQEMPDAASTNSPGAIQEPCDDTHEPSRLAILTEFHEEVGKLPDEERLVFELYYFAEFTQSQVADLLKIHPKRVSRLWLSATSHLAHCADGLQEVV